MRGWRSSAWCHCAGNIGTSHARSLSQEVAGAQVSWLYDADVARANALADEIGARVAPTVEQLIASSDAVVIASPDALHAEQALICLDAQRPTLCEKPLAPTVPEATSVVDAEIDLGQRLISLGFMRRFDPGYVALKESLSFIGQPLIVHNVHRNEYAPYGLTTSGTLTNSAIHEIDINRWLLDDDYATVQVVAGKAGPRTPEGELDPILMLLTTRGGVSSRWRLSSTLPTVTRCAARSWAARALSRWVTVPTSPGVRSARSDTRCPSSGSAASRTPIAGSCRPGWTPRE